LDYREAPWTAPKALLGTGVQGQYRESKFRVAVLHPSIALTFKMADAKKEPRPLTEEDKKELRATFDILDDDKDGSLSLSEIQTVLFGSFVMASISEVEELMNNIDTDKDGKITYEEFEAFAIRKGLVPVSADVVSEDLRDAFEVLDTDKSGFIDVEEFKKFMTNFGEKLSDEETEKLIKQADTNGDGVIDYKEFVAFMETFIP